MTHRSEAKFQLRMSWVCHALSPVAAVKPTHARPWFSSTLCSSRSGTLSTGVSMLLRKTESKPTPEFQSPDVKKCPANVLATKWSVKSLWTKSAW